MRKYLLFLLAGLCLAGVSSQAQETSEKGQTRTTYKHPDLPGSKYGFDWQSCNGAKKELQSFLSRVEFDKSGANVEKVLGHIAQYNTRLNKACQGKVSPYECSRVKVSCNTDPTNPCCTVQKPQPDCPMYNQMICAKGYGLTKVREENGCYRPACEKLDRSTSFDQ